MYARGHQRRRRAELRLQREVWFQRNHAMQTARRLHQQLLASAGQSFSAAAEPSEAAVAAAGNGIRADGSSARHRQHAEFCPLASSPRTEEEQEQEQAPTADPQADDHKEPPAAVAAVAAAGMTVDSSEDDAWMDQTFRDIFGLTCVCGLLQPPVSPTHRRAAPAEEDIAADNQVSVASPVPLAWLVRGRQWLQVLRPEELRSRFTPDFYARLKTRPLRQSVSVHERSILKDINRTLPGHPLFESPFTGRQRLFSILRAYSCYDLSVGYSQAMSQIVAMLLLHIPDEQQVFWCLVRLFYSPPWSHREFFVSSDDFALLKDCCWAMERLVQKRLPRLWRHLAEHGLDDAVLFATPWFLTVFSYRYPLVFAALAWDLYLEAGLPALFRVGLALLQWQEPTLLRTTGEERLLPAITSGQAAPDMEVIILAKRISFKPQELQGLLQEARTHRQAQAQANPRREEA